MTVQIISEDEYHEEWMNTWSVVCSAVLQDIILRFGLLRVDPYLSEYCSKQTRRYPIFLHVLYDLKRLGVPVEALSAEEREALACPPPSSCFVSAWPSYERRADTDPKFLELLRNYVRFPL